MNKLHFLLRPGWLAGIAVMLGFAAVCWTVLAPWQFSRHAQRSETNDRLVAALSAPTVAATEALTVGGAQPTDLIWHAATATGTFLTADQVYVRLRQDSAGRAAVEVLLPFRLADGTVLLIDRGYWPTDALSAGRLPPPPPEGEQTITGRIQPTQPDPRQRPAINANGRREVYGIEVSSLRPLPDVRAGFLQLTPDSPGVLSAIGTPVPDAGPFLSYAWQWITFGTMAVLALGYFIIREIRDPRDQPHPNSLRHNSFQPDELYDT